MNEYNKDYDALLYEVRNELIHTEESKSLYRLLRGFGVVLNEVILALQKVRQLDAGTVKPEEVEAAIINALNFAELIAYNHKGSKRTKEDTQ